MGAQMSQNTRQEVLEKLRGRYSRAGRQHKTKIINEVVELFGHHRKAAIRALKPRPKPPAAPFVRGRPKEYSPEKLLPPIKAIWLQALQPCGERLKSCLPDWLPAYEADHRRLDARCAPRPAQGQPRDARTPAPPPARGTRFALWPTAAKLRPWNRFVTSRPTCPLT